MCKCTPNKRTPWCGAPGCIGPAQSPAPAPVRKVILEAGHVRRLYVYRTISWPPIVVENCDTLERHYATNVVWSDLQHVGETELKWSGKNGLGPSMWVETDAELELTL